MVGGKGRPPAIMSATNTGRIVFCILAIIVFIMKIT